MENKTVRLEIKEIAQDDDVFTFEGYLAVFNNVDFGGDRIEPDALDDWMKLAKANGEKSIPVFWVHRSSEPVGIMPIDDMRIDEKGLFVKGQLPKDDTFVSGRVIPQMKIGSVAKMSIGYETLECTDEKTEDAGWVTVLKKLYLFEGSLVPIAMNDEARVTGMKAVVAFSDLPLADRQRPWDADSALGRIREWAGIDDNDNGSLADPDIHRKYRKAFFWVELPESDKLGAYKLPFADIIDGKLTAVPRGVFAAAAAMRGARGGVFIPSNERPGVMRNIEKYYEKMGIESPFGKSFRIDDLACIDERNLEALLKQGARFSNKMAPAIVSAIKSAGLRDVAADLRDGDKTAEESKAEATFMAALEALTKQIGGK